MANYNEFCRMAYNEALAASAINEPPKEPARVEFYEGQKVDAKDGGWHSAIIKQVGVNDYGQRCVKVGWLLDQWANARYDKTWSEDEWDRKIRDPDTKLPYSKLAARQSSDNKRDNKSDLKKENANTEKNIIKLEKQNRKLMQTTVDQEKKYNTLLQKYNKSTREIVSLKEKIEQKERKCNNVTNKNLTLTSEIATLKSKANSDGLLTAVNQSLKQQTIDQENKYNSLLQKYNKATKEISTLKLTIKKNQKYYNKTNNDLTAVNVSLKQQTVDQERKYSLSLEKYNKAQREISSLKQTIEQKERNYNELRKEISDLKTQNASVMETNNDLNEECKELKMELKDVKHKYNKWVQQNSDYTTWDYNIITDWIIGLDEQFMQYENELRKQLKQEEITGNDLIDLDKNDLNRFGIRVFKHKKRIIQEIQKLVMQKQNNNAQNDDNIVAYNEGKKDTAFIEQ